MLEKLGTPGYTTITKPDFDVIDACKKLVEGGNDNVVFAEVGVGIGATTIRIAELLNNRGTIHIFDFDDSVSELTSDLRTRGFKNVVPHGNSNKYWDSYHWALARMIEKEGAESLFDIVYIDGAHTYLHDALAFFLCDRLLKVGGIMFFDDYEWTFSGSNYMKKVRGNYMTDEQQAESQIRMVINSLVKTSSSYEEVVRNKGYRKKTRSTHPTAGEKIWRAISGRG